MCRAKTYLLLVLMVFIFASGCVKNKPPQPAPDLSYSPGGIEIRYSASSDLNTFDSKPHTLLLVAYQLSDVNAFNTLAAGDSGVVELLKAKLFDASAVGVQKFIVQPGEEKSIKFDRAENAKWVAVVAGYYSIIPTEVIRLFQIPVLIEEQGLISKEKSASLGHLLVNLKLGASEIYRIGGE